MNSCQYCLVHGDCIKEMTKLNAGSVDVVVTSPPYNLGIKYSTYDDNKSQAGYIKWCLQWTYEISRVLRSDGSFFLNLGNSSKNPFFAFEIAMSIKKYFKLQNTIHWIKSISIEKDYEVKSYGHFKPINSNRFLNDCHEYVFHFTHEGSTRLDRNGIGVPYVDKSNIERWSHAKGKDKRCRGNTWFIPYKTINKRAKDRPHPATFPTELAVKCIRLHGKRNVTVLDPFLGIGHSALAARNCSDLVDRFIGFEIDEEYIKIAAIMTGCDYSSPFSGESQF